MSSRAHSSRRLPLFACSLIATLAIPLVSPLAQTRPATRPAGARATAVQQPPTGPLTFDSTVFGALRWREMGPARGGRSVAVGASVQRPNEYWMGTTGGGVFKSVDGGQN